MNNRQRILVDIICSESTHYFVKLVVLEGSLVTLILLLLLLSIFEFWGVDILLSVSKLLLFVLFPKLLFFKYSLDSWWLIGMISFMPITTAVVYGSRIGLPVGFCIAKSVIPGMTVIVALLACNPEEDGSGDDKFNDFGGRSI